MPWPSSPSAETIQQQPSNSLQYHTSPCHHAGGKPHGAKGLVCTWYANGAAAAEDIVAAFAFAVPCPMHGKVQLHRLSLQCLRSLVPAWNCATASFALLLQLLLLMIPVL